MLADRAIAATALASFLWLQPAWANCGLNVENVANSRPGIIAEAARGYEAEAITAAGPDYFLRSLVRLVAKNPSGAVRELAKAVDNIDRVPPSQRPARLAKLGYWSAQAMAQEGNTQGARDALADAASRDGTFYASIARDSGSLDGAAYPRPRFEYLDPRTSETLVWAVIRVESHFGRGAVSPANALGLMQVIPETASRVTGDAGLRFDRARMLRDDHYNVAIGSTYLGWLEQRYGGYLPLALAAYNAGEGCADEWIRRIGDPRTEVDPLLWLEAIPLDETRNYVQTVLASYAGYESIRSAGK